MSASLTTQVRAAQWDSLRESQGVTGNLTLYKTDTNGYTLLATITSGWWTQDERDTIEGTRTKVVKVALTDENAAVLIPAVTGHVSAVTFMGLRFAVHHRAAPFGDPSQWVFRCDPTGETV